MKKSLVFLMAVFGLLWTNNVHAQRHFAFELRSGISIATQDLGDANLNTGFGFEGILDYQFIPQLGVYAGWGWNKFAADDSFAGAKADFEETGYLLGLQFNQPIGTGPLSLFARAGAIYNHIEVENETGDITADSGHGWGWRAGLGLDIDLGSDWHLKPGIKFQQLSRELTIESETTEVDLSYLGINVGIAKRF